MPSRFLPSRRLRRTLAVAAGLLVATSVSAGPAPLWLCGLSAGATRLVCVAEQDPVLEALSASPDGSASSAVIRGASFPLDPQRRYSVDLLGPATDMEMVAQLAQATMCLRSPGCRVVLRPGVSVFDDEADAGGFVTGPARGRSAALGALR